MVNLPFPSGARVYFDTNIFIYLIEAGAHPNMQRAIKTLFAACDVGHIAPVTSQLALGEVLPLPLRQNNQQLVQTYRDFFTMPSVLEVVPISLEIIDAAAVLRAHASIKTPDALHVATALERDCTFFITNDAKIKLPVGLPITLVLLSDF